MMSVFNDPDMRRGILVHVIAGAVLTALCAVFGIAAAIAAVTVSVVFTVIYVIMTAIRYREIARLSRSIDRILHGRTIYFLPTAVKGSFLSLRAR